MIHSYKNLIQFTFLKEQKKKDKKPTLLYSNNSKACLSFFLAFL